MQTTLSNSLQTVLTHFSNETLNIHAEIIKSKLIISSPERKIFTGRLSSGSEYCEGDLIFRDFSLIIDTGEYKKSYQHKIVVLDKIDEENLKSSTFSKLLTCEKLGIAGLIILEGAKILNHHHLSQKDSSIPVLFLPKDKLLHWAQLHLIVKSQQHPNHQSVPRHPFRLDEGNKRLLKSLLQNRRDWHRALFGEIKPLNFSPIFGQHYDSFGHGVDLFNLEDKDNLVFLYVTGLYHGRFPGRQTSFQNSIQHMKDTYNLDFRYISIDNDKGVLHNAKTIASVITRYYKEMQKQIVVIGHSKGAVDISVAITLYPKIQKMIRLFLSLMGAFGGSPIASLCVYNRTQKQKQEPRVVVKKLIRNMMKCSTDALLDITLEARHKFLLKHSYPVKAVPTVSVIATRGSNPSILSRFITKMYNEENDALITVTDAYIPGSNIIFIPKMDHRGPDGSNSPFNNCNLFFPSLITSSLLATSSKLLTRPLTLCKNHNCCSIPFDHVTISYTEPSARKELEIVQDNLDNLSPFLGNIPIKVE